MQQQNSRFLGGAIVAGSLLVVLAALILTFSPLLWTDRVMNRNLTAPLPPGCSIQTTTTSGGFVAVAHCPAWVQLPF